MDGSPIILIYTYEMCVCLSVYSPPPWDWRPQNWTKGLKNKTEGTKNGIFWPFWGGLYINDLLWHFVDRNHINCIFWPFWSRYNLNGMCPPSRCDHHIYWIFWIILKGIKNTEYFKFIEGTIEMAYFAPFEKAQYRICLLTLEGKAPYIWPICDSFE